MKSHNSAERKSKSRFIIPVIFVLTVFAFVGVVLYRRYFAAAEKPIVRARTVVPVATSERASGAEELSSIIDAAEITSFIELNSSEILLSSMTFDFDGDNFDDQIVAVRKSDSPYIYLIVAIYIPATNSYARVEELETGITRTRTFSYAGMDITGSHRAALVFQGVRDDGMNVMNIYHCNGAGMSREITLIGSFESDGTIFIQQFDRSVSYDLSQSSGNSFSVWVYSYDVGEINSQSGSSIGQIQTEYTWNVAAGRYVQSDRRYVEGAVLAEEERAKILDGTIETFAGFMDGLWYKISNEGESIRFLYFDYGNREIVFLYADAQEIYRWEDSNLNRNGMYLTSSNAEISNLQRRFDITLASIDTVQMHIIDDVRTLIREATVWDGEYRKMTSSNTLVSVTDKKNSLSLEIKNILEGRGKWLVNGSDVFSFSSARYSFVFGSNENTGAYSIYPVGDATVIQFRSLAGATPALQGIPQNFGAYRIVFGQKEIPASGRTPAHMVENRDEIIFVPVSLSPTGVTDIDSPEIILTRTEDSLTEDD